MFDLIIRGARVYDGSGNTPVIMDVGLLGDRISATGDLSSATAREERQAQGLMLCPGFIDVHSHSDTYLLVEPNAPSKITQGVTTEVVGNCGASAAPLLGSARLPSDWASKTYPETWSSVAEYRQLIDEVQPAVNACLLVGHNTLRGGVCGYENSPVSEADLNLMQKRLDQALEEGASGLSSGLVYAPGCFAPPEEVQALGQILSKHEAIYTSHMRSEGVHLLEAIDETIAVGESSGCRVQLSHLKTSGPANWHKIDAALARIESAQQRGVRVRADRYPYIAACTDLDILLPDWAAEGTRSEIIRRLRTPSDRARIRKDIVADRSEDYWARVQIGATTHPNNKPFSGQRLPDVARALGLEPVDAALHLMDTDELATGGIFFGMNEENMWRILAQPWVMLGSDASIRSIDGPLSTDFPHPRAYGSFPRFLKAALDGKTVPVQEAVYKMTVLAADQFQLKQRGLIREGYFADLVLIQEQDLADLSTYKNPHQYAQGIQEVLVNGVSTYRNGQFTSKRGGRVI